MIKPPQNMLCGRHLCENGVPAPVVDEQRRGEKPVRLRYDGTTDDFLCLRLLFHLRVEDHEESFRKESRFRHQSGGAGVKGIEIACDVHAPADGDLRCSGCENHFREHFAHGRGGAAVELRDTFPRISVGSGESRRKNTPVRKMPVGVLVEFIGEKPVRIQILGQGRLNENHIVDMECGVDEMYRIVDDDAEARGLRRHDIQSGGEIQELFITRNDINRGRDRHGGERFRQSGEFIADQENPDPFFIRLDSGRQGGQAVLFRIDRERCDTLPVICDQKAFVGQAQQLGASIRGVDSDCIFAPQRIGMSEALFQITAGGMD